MHIDLYVYIFPDGVRTQEPAECCISKDTDTDSHVFISLHQDHWSYYKICKKENFCLMFLLYSILLVFMFMYSSCAICRQTSPLTLILSVNEEFVFNVFLYNLFKS